MGSGNDIAKALAIFGTSYMAAKKDKKQEKKEEARWQAEFNMAMERLTMEKTRFERENIKMMKELDDAAKERKQKAYDDYWNLVLKENVPPAAAKAMINDMHDILVDVPDDVAAQTKFDQDVASMTAATDEAYSRQLGAFQAYGEMGVPLPGMGGAEKKDKPSIGSEAERRAAYDVFGDNAQAFLAGDYQPIPEEMQAFTETVRHFQTNGDEPKPVFTSEELAKMAPLLPTNRIEALKAGEKPTDEELGIYKEVAGGTQLGKLAVYTAQNYGADKAQSLFSGKLPTEEIKSITTEFSTKDNLERMGTVKKAMDTMVDTYGIKDQLGNVVTTTIPGVAGDVPQLPPEYMPRYIQLRDQLNTASEMTIPTTKETQAQVDNQRKVDVRNNIQSTLSAEPQRQPTNPWAAGAASMWMNTSGKAFQRLGEQLSPVVNNPIVNPIKETGKQVGGELVDWTKGLFDAAANPDIGYSGYIKQKILEGPGLTPMTGPNPNYQFTPNPLEKALEEFTRKFSVKK